MRQLTVTLHHTFKDDQEFIQRDSAVAVKVENNCEKVYLLDVVRIACENENANQLVDGDERFPVGQVAEYVLAISPRER